MISTGIYGLDDMLGGGIPEGSRVLYSMEPGVNGQLFMISTLSCALTKGKSCLVILPHTTVDAFLHDAANMRASKKELASKKIVFIDAIDRERIQRATKSANAAEEAWKERIAKVCKEKKVEMIFAYFDLLNEDFGMERGLSILASARTDTKPTIIIEQLNLDGAALLDAIGHDNIFDLIVSIKSSFHPLPHFNYFTIVRTSWSPLPTRSVPFVISDGRIVPYIPRIVVTGPAKSGKSTFVANASEHGFSVDRKGLDGDTTTVAMDLGWLPSKDFDITIYGTPGEQRFDPLIPPALIHAMGVVLVIDAAKPDTMPRAKYLLGMVAKLKIPIVIAANKKDLKPLMSEREIRDSLGVPKDIPIFFISATRRDDVALVLESLVDFITRFTY
jgi:signal recognition particle receptor subunit beta